MACFQLFWFMVLYSTSAVDLYIGRIFAGATGGGMYICLPLFVAEVADQRWVTRIHIERLQTVGKIARCHDDACVLIKKFMHLNQHFIFTWMKSHLKRKFIAESVVDSVPF